MELLEREGALAALQAAHRSAADGDGRVALVSGEPGIGKTSLVAAFLADLGDARILIGTCDDLSIPRPLGPLRDLVGAASPALAVALQRDAPPHEVQSLLLAELERAPHPVVLVLEDLHWADDATCDAITVLGRRIGTLPALLVVTYRSGEVPRGHPLQAAIGSIRAEHAAAVELAPLSASAVATLAGPRAGDVYAATGGNPFYVTELLATAPAVDVPPSIANAVLGRAARLDEPSRHLVELVSVVPNRIRTSLLDAVLPGWPAAAEEPERRALLAVTPTHVAFRHELARHAILAAIPAGTRRRLHADILAALLAADADPSDIVHHAEAAGAEETVRAYALVAARRAAALRAHREAWSHYARAADFVADLPLAERAVMLEEIAGAAYAAGRLAEGLSIIEQATAAFAELGDTASVGRCTRRQSRYHWFAGDGEPARALAREAVDILEPLGPSEALARAYAELAQLAMLAETGEESVAWSERALDLASEVGDGHTRFHALVTLESTHLQAGAEPPAGLLEAHALAAAGGDDHEAARALVNLSYGLICWVRPQEAERFARQALAYAEEREVHTMVPYIRTMLAWLQLRSGDWDGAERATRELVGGDRTVAQMLGRTVLAELAVRRGDPGAANLLPELFHQAQRTGELQRLAPLVELEAEAALTAGTPPPLLRFQLLAHLLRDRGAINGWGPYHLAAWGAVVGVDVPTGRGISVPHAAMIDRDWRGAADAFGAAGWPYDRALLLSLLDDREALTEALEIARGLGAAPLTGRVTRRMRELGLRVPRGPREATRANPAGLTPRQLEVLDLLAAGCTNAEIAERLVLSPRTAEHHVAAVLSKLGATSRRDAVRLARAGGTT